MISRKKIDEIVKTIVVNVNPERVILFGSYAEGAPNEDSDLDILVVKNTSIPRHKRAREIRKYLRGIKVPIDLLVYTQEEIDDWKDEKHAFINKTLEMGEELYGEKGRIN
ncbi:MAG: nucleotidyltransferase domain-containing protein [Alkaliphilus sp.]